MLQFQYEGYCINILDTPGHQDFSEDTYRTLMAADCAVMVIDAAKGVEAQTRKLFKVCAMRDIPIFTFINKMDREARDPFDLWRRSKRNWASTPIPSTGPSAAARILRACTTGTSRRSCAFRRANGGQEGRRRSRLSWATRPGRAAGAANARQLSEDIELLDGAACEFDLNRVRHGKLSPVFFGSALTNFGVEPFLEDFLRLTTPPLPRKERAGELVDPCEDDFSAFVFKIQANMNKAHRDRIAFHAHLLRQV